MVKNSTAISTGNLPFPAVLRICVFAFIIRLCAYTAAPLLSERPELSSPLVSFKRLQDGVALNNDDIDPYSDDTFHFQPAVLFTIGKMHPLAVFFLFCFLDCLTGLLLAKSVTNICQENSEQIELTVLKCFVLNPITACSASIMSVSSLHNFLLAGFVYAFSSGNLVLASLFLSMVVQVCLYPIVLVGSLLLRFTTYFHRAALIGLLITGISLMIFINYAMNGFRWNFLDNTYGFMLRVDDLAPNCGIFWYFFTQVFTHFRSFYLTVFQINLLVYVIPLLLALRKDSFLHLVISLLLVAVFSPYPTLNDSAVYMALLPALGQYWKQPIRFVLLVAATIVTCVVLMPVMWHMWIVNGSGNANFYFAITIIYNVAQIYLMMDLLFAYFREDTQSICAEEVSSGTTFVFN